MHAAPWLGEWPIPIQSEHLTEQLTEVSMVLAELQAMSPVQTDPSLVDLYVIPIKSNKL